MRFAWQRSSVVEQRNHNPLVGGPNPSAATRINKRPDGSFFYSVRRGGEGHQDPTKKQVLQVQRGETVAIWKGARTQSVWEYTIPPLHPTLVQLTFFYGFSNIHRNLNERGFLCVN